VILVLLGTNPYPFERLARAVDDLAGRLGWDVFIQSGHTVYDFKHCRFVPFLRREDVLAKVHVCEFMIVQGGCGSIHEGLAAGKPVIAAPRQPELGESQDRQEELVHALESKGCVIGLYDVTDLESAVAHARTFRAAPLPPNQIPSIIRNFLKVL